MLRTTQNGELHLMVLWETARYKENEILADIRNHLKILECYDIKWSDRLVEDNFSRFYGVKLGSNSAKTRECGRGRFLLLLLWDEHPRYDFVCTSRGHEYVNVNIFGLKEKYRKWTNGGSKIHATNNPRETNHDLTLLLGTNYEDYLAKFDRNSSEAVHKLDRDLSGARGWKSLDELFYVLNATAEYVVLRGFENLEETLASKKHGDIDILVRDYANTVMIINGKTCFADQRPHYLTKVGDREIYMDLWDIKKNYHDPKWENKILETRKLYNGLYVPDDENYFYLLIYHVTIHKQQIVADYFPVVKDLFYKNALDKKYNLSAYQFPFDLYFKLLKDFMKEKGYCFTRPQDPVVFYNERLIRADEITAFLEKNYFLRDVRLVMVNSGSCSGYMYLEAYQNDKKLFIKWGGIGDSCVNEYKFARRLYDENPKNFVEPVFFRFSGEQKFIAYEYIAGQSLESLSEKGVLKNKDKGAIVRQIKVIAQNLLAADCVHRDIRPANFILTPEGQLVLIDLQFAVSASKYRELPVLKKNRGMLKCLGCEFARNDYSWDDMYSLAKMLDFIGRDEAYGRDFDDALSFVRENIGKKAVAYNIKKDRSKTKAVIRILSLLIPVKSWRKKFRKMWEN